METKRIFVLGNGFDLAHYLPTKYEHFMAAMKSIEEHEKDVLINFDEIFKNFLTENQFKNKNNLFLKTKELYKTDHLKLSSETVEYIQKKLKINGWFQHFSHHLENVETWIDFENEIESLLVKMCDFFEMSFDDKTIGYFEDSSSLYDNIDNKRLTIKAIDVLAENHLQVDKAFFDNFELRKTFVQNTLRNFNLINDVYYKAEDTYHPNSFRSNSIELSKISVEEFKELKESNSAYARRVTKKSFKNVIDTSFLKQYSDDYQEFDGNKVLRQMLSHLNDFNDIFKMYINIIVNELKPIKEFKKFSELGESLQAIFTFNYSNSFERLYPNINLLGIENVQYVHGNTVSKKIVLGISDLEDERLRKYKVYGFVKTHQKLLNDTDYLFLDHKHLDVKRENPDIDSNDFIPYEIIFWGHSLADSDAEYIKAVFEKNAVKKSPNIILKVWHFEDQPHEQLANLIHIMSKEVIEFWMKEKWLVFERAPNIYEKNRYFSFVRKDCPIIRELLELKHYSNPYQL